MILRWLIAHRSDRLHDKEGTMLRWIGDSLTFMFWLSVLQLTRLAVVLMCVAEAVIVVTLWPIGFVFWQMNNQPMYLLMPIGATLLVAIQVALWQFTWLRLAQRGGHWRALAEHFSTVVRYPVVRTPHEWE
jgi:hypothetical protein